MEQLTCELNGTKYLLVDMLSFSNDAEEVRDLLEKYDCIFQGISKVNNGFFTRSYAIIKVLVPEHNVVAFNKERKQ